MSEEETKWLVQVFDGTLVGLAVLIPVMYVIMSVVDYVFYLIFG